MSRVDLAAIGFGQEAERAAAESGDAGASAEALAALGWTQVYLDASRARPHLLQACELAREAGHQRCLAYALHGLTYTEWNDLEAARALGEQALAISMAQEYRLMACYVHLTLSTLASMQGRLDDAIEHGTKSLHIAEAVGERVIHISALNSLAENMVYRGDYAAARDHSSAAGRLANASGNPLLTGIAALVTGLLSYADGNSEQARAALGPTIPVLSVHFGGVFAPHYAALLADADLHAGDTAAAREHATHAATLAEQSATDWGRSHAALATGRIHLHDGEIDAATSAAHRALELADRTKNRLTTIDALELLAAIATRRRSPVSAVRLLSAAAAARRRIGYVRFRIHTADHKQLVTELEASLGTAEFARCQADGERMSLADALAIARSRRGSRRRPAAGWDALTPAERRVLALVGEGLNNVQIAARLFVTRDTVKGHVSSTLRKLGLSSRAELAAETTRRTAAATADRHR